MKAAAVGGHLEIAIFLLERGADPNASGDAEEGRTALEAATKYGHLDIVHILPNAEAERSETAVASAENEGHFAISDSRKEKTKDWVNGMRE
jgi:ankyrin repeat protein